MNTTFEAKDILNQFHSDSTKLGDLKKMAREIKKDHDLAMELWASGEYYPRLLATLILDKNTLDQEMIDRLDKDLESHTSEERNHIMEWLMANQLTKSKRTLSLIESWEKSSSALQRRTYWYHQARLRWTGQKSPENTEELLDKIESTLAKEEPDVQWAMNFTAAWIGVFDERYRKRCIQIGEQTGLYKDEVVARGCTPNYLPAFIQTEVDKRKGKYVNPTMGSEYPLYQGSDPLVSFSIFQSMNPASHVAQHFHQVLFGGNWTWANLKDTLSDVSHAEATEQVGDLNTILSLTHHIGYYFGVQLKVLQGGPLEGKDEESWKAPSIASQDDWEGYVEAILRSGDRLSRAIAAVPREKWDQDFTDAKYGSYYRNFHGMIEHTHYHLGQIALLKKLIRSGM
ncbi:MAG: hypothetical protein HKN79_09070 [Flavobacteriales bacterium]|nr:hypothetical protein [Flavobacteriales bacterium]